MDRAAFGYVACSKKFLLLLGLPVQVHVVDDDLHDNNNDQEDDAVPAEQSLLILNSF